MVEQHHVRAIIHVAVRGRVVDSLTTQTNPRNNNKVSERIWKEACGGDEFYVK
jgi:hypothetical protein